MIFQDQPESDDSDIRRKLIALVGKEERRPVDYIDDEPPPVPDGPPPLDGAAPATCLPIPEGVPSQPSTGNGHSHFSKPEKKSESMDFCVTYWNNKTIID